MIVAILITLQIFTISEDISVNYAGMYADEIVNSVNENLSVDLAVIEAFSKRHEIIDWFLDEEDSEKKEIAFQEFELMREQLLNQNYFVAVDQTKNFYYVDNTTKDINTEGDKTYAPTGILSETEILDNWYFETKNMKQQYDLNIDLDRYLNILRVWINYKVVAGDEVIGVFGTGIEITGFIKEVLTQHAQNGTKTFVIDSSGMIQLDADSINIRENSFQENVNLDQGITNIVSSNEFDRIMKDYLLNPNQETIFSIEGSTYDYIAVSPIKDTGWHVITLFDSKSLFQKSDFLPIVLIVIILFLAYTVIISQIINRLFIVPFYQLNRSIMEKGNQLGGRIFGL
ncbi:MAG: cache domain-containing protein, partial [Vallitaleaceae bacterium]|nr:cache domain-containing protein [Vallitaleaceae bacterium]